MLQCTESTSSQVLCKGCQACLHTQAAAMEVLLILWDVMVHVARRPSFSSLCKSCAAVQERGAHVPKGVGRAADTRRSPQ
jgi:hypothetical protein